MHAPLDLLDVAAGLDVLEGLRVEGRPVCYAAEEAAQVHEVKVGLWVDPVTAAVVDFESHVRGLLAWLDGGEVGADHVC